MNVLIMTYFVLNVVWLYVLLFDHVVDDYNHRMNNNRISILIFVLIDEEKYVFVHNFFQSFDMNMMYIDKLKQEIFHVLPIVDTEIRQKMIVGFHQREKNMNVDTF